MNDGFTMVHNGSHAFEHGVYQQYYGYIDEQDDMVNGWWLMTFDKGWPSPTCGWSTMVWRGTTYHNSYILHPLIVDGNHGRSSCWLIMVTMPWCVLQQSTKSCHFFRIQSVVPVKSLVDKAIMSSDFTVLRKGSVVQCTKRVDSLYDVDGRHRDCNAMYRLVHHDIIYKSTISL